MNSLILIFIHLICIALPQMLYPSFQQYIKTFQKKYDQPQLYSQRQNIYNRRIAYFTSITQYQPGVNNMSDWTDQQINQYKNLLNINPDQRLARPPPALSRLASPLSVDWRELGAVTSIKNQGRCGSCWAFAAAAYAESKLIVDKRFTNTTINLSEQYLVSCTKYSNCSGGYLQYAMKMTIKMPTESSYPYQPYNTQPSQICSSDGIVIGQKNLNYYNLKDAQIITFLLNSPIAISISSNGWENYGSGVFQCKQNSLISVDHAVLLVGYTEDYWIIKNQWGILWGQNGFMRITRKNSNNCLIGTSAHIIQGGNIQTNDTNYASNEEPSSGKLEIRNNTVTSHERKFYYFLTILLAFLMLIY